MQSDDNRFELEDEDDDDLPTQQFSSESEASALLDDPISKVEAGCSIGRYKIRRRIGAGGFGVVFLADDGILKREVCIKISRTPDAAQRHKQFLLITEAQAAASLDHDNIVRVFDAGQWEDYPYLVMEYVAGATLGHEIRSSRKIPFGRALMLMEQVAKALAHLHSRGLIHRDLKPANILISKSDEVKLTDFGLAISDEMPVWNKQQVAGTQMYMAPEQVLGETHRIDGRTDIWGFGVVLYELLTTKPPFRATDPRTLFQCILKGDAPSLRQRRPDIPHSLDQFCLRCLSQCMSDRYQSAAELLEELAVVKNGLDESHTTEYRSSTVGVSHTPHLMQDSPVEDSSGLESTSGSAGATPTSKKNSQTNDSTSLSSSKASGSHSETIEIVPRGLRAFDEEDYGFFLKLIPGPRGARGIPLSLRFWKNWVATKDGDIVNAVGVLYGPSGSGKSSFIKAGLIPTIRETTTPVYVDFTVNQSVAALLSQLRKSFPQCSPDSDLTSTLASIRNASRERITVLVLDQFEQYLANTPLNLQHELVQSLRQCDGQRLKAILLVRDEFWNSISQFMHLMESSLSDQRNALSLPLLNQRHAERVLEAIGRAYENLPGVTEPVSDSQRMFIEQAVQLLSQDGQVVCVRLAMFAEFMRNHEWDPKTLVRLGGVDGAAIKYLKESFDTQTAPISHRSVAQPCRDILRNLLPSQALDIKSSAKSKEELRLVVGEQFSQFTFDQAINVLESELRLLSVVGQSPEGKPLYSLTHDYLVKPVKDWIFEHEESTWQGRARNKLTALAARYDIEPSNRNLPTIAEWFAIQAVASRNRRTVSEHTLMQSATRVVLTKLATMVAIGMLLISVAWYAVDASNKTLESERSKAVAAVELFLASKPNGLELAAKGLANVQARLAKQEYAKKVYIGDNGFDNRLVLLGALLVEKVVPERVIPAVKDAEHDIKPVWRSAFSNSQLRDSVFKSLGGESKISPQLHWQFLANNDFRTLSRIEQLDEPDRTILCHQIVACALEELTPITWNPDRLEEWVAQKPLDSELHVLATLMEGLVSDWKDVGISRIERQSTASKAAIAMSAQWYLEKSKNAPIEFQPAKPEADWMVERPMPGVSIPMIRIPAGTMAYIERGMANSEDRPVAIIIEDDFWVAQERIGFDLADRWIKSQGMGDSIELKYRNGYAVFANVTSICLFCNSLSKALDYKPAYSFEHDSSATDRVELSPGIYWILQSDGFRIPTKHERVYFTSCGNYRSVILDLYKNKGYQHRSRTVFPADNNGIFAPHLAVPNPWGLSNTISSLQVELLYDTSRRTMVGSLLTEDVDRNLISVAVVKQQAVQQTSLRLTRAPVFLTTDELGL